jgi:hypothetical protein
VQAVPGGALDTFRAAAPYIEEPGDEDGYNDYADVGQVEAREGE